MKMENIYEKFIDEKAEVKISMRGVSFPGIIKDQGDDYILLADGTYILKDHIRMVQKCN